MTRPFLVMVSSFLSCNCRFLPGFFFVLKGKWFLAIFGSDDERQELWKKSRIFR
jgi:hypothetical protein